MVWELTIGRGISCVKPGADIFQDRVRTLPALATLTPVLATRQRGRYEKKLRYRYHAFRDGLCLEHVSFLLNANEQRPIGCWRKAMSWRLRRRFKATRCIWADKAPWLVSRGVQPHISLRDRKHQPGTVKANQ